MRCLTKPVGAWACVQGCFFVNKTIQWKEVLHEGMIAFDVGENMSKHKQAKKSFLIQGSILAGAGILTKIIGFIYRIPMSNLLGDRGNGVYTVAFGIYNIALTLSSYSMPLAVSKLVAARLAKGEKQNAKRVFRDAFFFAVFMGLLACLALYFGADLLEGLYKRQGLSKPLRILAPTTLVVALLGAFRGYFQGHHNMVPTAVSQVLEQIMNAIVSVVASYGFIKLYAGSDMVYAYGAAGGTMGTLMGAMIALVYFVILYLVTRQDDMGTEDTEEALEEHKLIYKAIIFTMIPVILSQTIYQIGYTIDDILYGNICALKRVPEEIASSLQGVFNTQYNQMINLPVAISTAMASSTIPSMVASKTRGETGELHEKITMVLKLNMLIAFPCMVGMTILSTPIIKLLFFKLTTYQTVASNLLLFGSSAIVFYALSSITTAILQGNDYMKLPLKHSAVSLVIHIALLSGLLYFTDLSVYALVIANVTFPLVVCVLNCVQIARKVGYRFELMNLFGKPLLASLLMGVFTYVIYEGLFRVGMPMLVATAVSIVVSMGVYFAFVIKLGLITKEEMKQLPGGRTLAAKIYKN